jgi:hypothetical protein
VNACGLDPPEPVGGRSCGADPSERGQGEVASLPDPYGFPANEAPHAAQSGDSHCDTELRLTRCRAWRDALRRDREDESGEGRRTSHYVMRCAASLQAGLDGRQATWRRRVGTRQTSLFRQMSRRRS